MRSAMRSLERGVAPLLLAANVAGVAFAARADLVSSNGVLGIPSGQAYATLASCTAPRTAIAGGVDSDGLNVVFLEELVPILPGGSTPLADDPGSYAAQPFFSFTAFNDGNSEHAVAYAAICAPFPATTVTGQNLVLPTAGSGADRVLCPEGTLATGGGIDLSADLVTTSTGPVLDDGSTDGARLTAVADGPAPAPIGWRASGRFPHGSVLESIARVAVVCVATPLTTRVESVTVPAGDQISKRALCPVGTVAYGGGVDGDGLDTATVTANAPIFDDGTANGERLLLRPLGDDAAPIGWFGSLRNDDTVDHTLKVAALCPEPVVEELGLAALSALFVTRRRRRRHSRT